MGYHSSGNELLHDAQTGEQLDADIFIGPTYYMRLKHMVKDKINHRARGPKTMMTRQSVHGRANDGGLRIGEMERDGILGHGMAAFLNDSFLNRGDEYYIAVCNNTGSLAIYNESKNLFLSPQADGPIKFVNNVDGTQNIKNISKFGRSFSILKVPYSFKLLLQELQAMNVNMRIITDDNVDNLMAMSYSDNINKIVDAKDLNEAEEKYVKYINDKGRNQRQNSKHYILNNPDAEIEDNEPSIQEANTETEKENENRENEISSSDPPYAPVSPAYNEQNLDESIEIESDTGLEDSLVQLNLEELDKNNEPQPENKPSDNTFLGFDIGSIFGDDKKEEKSVKKVSILDVEEDKVEVENKEDNTDNDKSNNDSSQVKKVTIMEGPEIK